MPGWQPVKDLHVADEPMECEASKQSDADNDAPDWPIPELVEELHYDLEDGLLVFTWVYHRLRGYCCRSSYRHCPYDHTNVP